MGILGSGLGLAIFVLVFVVFKWINILNEYERGVIFLLSRVLRVHRTAPITGAEGLVGEIADVIAETGEGSGKVFVHGEYWDAVASVPLAPGTRARVMGIEGQRLRVGPASARDEA